MDRRFEGWSSRCGAPASPSFAPACVSRSHSALWAEAVRHLRTPPEGTPDFKSPLRLAACLGPSEKSPLFGCFARRRIRHRLGGPRVFSLPRGCPAGHGRSGTPPPIAPCFA